MSTPNRLILAYIKVRDKKKEIKKAHDAEYARLNAVQDRIGNELLRLMDEQYPGSAKAQFSCDAGVAFRLRNTTYSCADWEGFYEWMYANRQAGMLTCALKQSAVGQYLEERMDEAGGTGTPQQFMPPGVISRSEYALRIQAPASKTRSGENENE